MINRFFVGFIARQGLMNYDGTLGFIRRLTYWHAPVRHDATAFGHLRGVSLAGALAEAPGEQRG
eukprot:4555763-Pyramimonas_sp.AAC.1